jgi:hypothetical protein
MQSLRNAETRVYFHVESSSLFFDFDQNWNVSTDLVELIKIKLYENQFILLKLFQTDLYMLI